MNKVNTILFIVFHILIITSSNVALKTVWIQISLLSKKPADLDLHCLQDYGYKILYSFQKSKLFKHRKV